MGGYLVQNVLVVNARLLILFLSDTYGGRIHDKPRKGTPLEILYYSWLETPTTPAYMAAVAGGLPYLGGLAGAPGDNGPAPAVGYWTAT